ncbi:MAG: hypothetical protein JJE03_04120 [Peptostreptococcaceae bacterium]|nr:hypothetical protein [Peptostreptococcaceae bacterium]
MVNYDEYKLNLKEYAIFILIFIFLALFISYILYHKVLPALFFVLVFSRTKEKVKKYLVDKRRKELLEQFKDLLFNLATALSTKASMKEAIGESKGNILLIYGDKSVLYKELDYMYKKMMLEDDVEVLKDFAVRAGIDDISDFVQIYASCKYTGANLIYAMNKAASVIIDKMTIEKEINEMIRRKKYEGMVILIMPILILFLLNISAADYVLILYTSIYGNVLMTTVIVSYIGIYELIERITKVKV